MFSRQDVALLEIKQKQAPFLPALTSKTNSDTYNIQLSPLTLLIMWCFCCALLLHWVPFPRKLFNKVSEAVMKHKTCRWKNESMEVLWMWDVWWWMSSLFPKRLNFLSVITMHLSIFIHLTPLPEDLASNAVRNCVHEYKRLHKLKKDPFLRWTAHIWIAKIPRCSFQGFTWIHLSKDILNVSLCI